MDVKIRRPNTKVFASKSKDGSIAKFNNNNNLITSYSKDVNELQNEDFERGATVLEGIKGGLSMQQLNGLLYILGKQIAYLYQDGISEYSKDEVYDLNSFTKKGSIIYRFKVENPYNNMGIELSDSRYWDEVIDFADTSKFFKKATEDNYKYLYENIFNSFVKDKHRYYAETKSLIRDDLTLRMREDTELHSIIENKVVTGSNIKSRIEDIILSNPNLSTKIIQDLIGQLTKQEKKGDPPNALIIALKDVILKKGGIIDDIRTQVLSVQVGSMVIFMLDPNDAPAGYLYCDGKAYKKDKYPDLYRAIGDRFERHYSGNSAMLKDEFAVPDMRNETTRGAGTKNPVLGAKQSGAIQYHTHKYATSKEEGYTGNNGWGYAVHGLKSNTIKQYETNMGNTSSAIFSDETRMRNVAVNYFIKY